MSEWTQDRPTEPGFWWAWKHGANPYLVEAAWAPGPVGCNFEMRRFGRAGWLAQSGMWDGRWWLRAEIEVPAPPPAAMPAWERVLRRHLDLGSPRWREIANAIRAEERSEQRGCQR